MCIRDSADADGAAALDHGERREREDVPHVLIGQYGKIRAVDFRGRFRFTRIEHDRVRVELGKTQRAAFKTFGCDAPRFGRIADGDRKAASLIGSAVSNFSRAVGVKMDVGFIDRLTVAVDDHTRNRRGCGKSRDRQKADKQQSANRSEACREAYFAPA